MTLTFPSLLNPHRFITDSDITVLSGRRTSLYLMQEHMSPHYQTKQLFLCVAGRSESIFRSSLESCALVAQEAIEACYSLLSTVQRLWRKVSREDDDDYIAQPKPSGYQSLHTAVIGKFPSPLPKQPYASKRCKKMEMLSKALSIMRVEH